MEHPLGYNEAKVDRDVASVLAFYNMDGLTEADIARTFRRYENMSRRTRNLSFHMSIDPLEGQDNMSDRDIIEFTRRLMESLGYGEQPYVIYRHDDISRVHYHVVSIRTDRNGKKIRDRREWQRCYDLVRQFSNDFDYKVGNDCKCRRKKTPDKFDPTAGDVIEQVQAIFNRCLGYHFTSFEQFRVILRSHGVHLDARSEGSTKIYLRGLDDSGRPCTNALTGKMLGMDLYQLYSSRASDNVVHSASKGVERNRIRRCAGIPLNDSVSQRDFVGMMARCGISVKIERDPKTHRITDANFVDHVTRSAFNISELGADLSLDMLQAADEQRWEHGVDRQGGLDITLGDFLAGLAAKGSKSMEKDLTDDPEKKKKKKGRWL